MKNLTEIETLKLLKEYGTIKLDNAGEEFFNMVKEFERKEIVIVYGTEEFGFVVKTEKLDTLFVK